MGGEDPLARFARGAVAVECLPCAEKRMQKFQIRVRAQLELLAFRESANCAGGDAAIDEQSLAGDVTAGFGGEEDYG